MTEHLLPDGTMAVIPDDLPRGERVKAEAELRRLWHAAGVPDDGFRADTVGRKAGQVALGAADTALFGFGDELAAALLSSPALMAPDRSFSSEYAGNVEDMRRRQTGGWYTAGQVGGMLVPGTVAGAVTNPAMHLLRNVPAAVAARTGALAHVPAQAMANAVAGGIGGALYGYGSGTGVEDRTDVAAKTGALGAGLGGIAGAGLALAERHVPGIGGPGNTISRSLRRDGVEGVADVERRFAALPPEQSAVATLMDVAGENTRALGSAVANLPGPAKDKLLPALEGRQMDAAGRMVRTLERVAENVGAPSTDIAAIKAARQAAAAPLYQQLDTMSVMVTPDLAALLKRPSAMAALKESVRHAADDGIAISEPVAKAIAEGALEGVAVPVRVLDVAKQRLDDLAGQARAGALANEARRYATIADDLRSAVIDATGGAEGVYAQALKEWAGPSKVIEAIETGRKYASSGAVPRGASPTVAATAGGSAKGVAADRMAGRATTVTDDPAFTAGVRLGLEDVIASTPLRANVADRVAGSPARQVILEKAVGPQGVEAIMPAIDAERAFAKTYGQVAMGSRTAPMLAEMGGIGAAPMTREGLAARIGQALLRKAFLPGEKGRTAMAEVLGEMSPERRRALVQALLARADEVAPLPRAGYAPAVGVTNLIGNAPGGG